MHAPREVATREPQYAECFAAPPVIMGPMAGYQWQTNPKRTLFLLARYKFVARMFAGLSRVAEIGCADGFAAAVVAQDVGRLDLYDFDPLFVAEARERHRTGHVEQIDIVKQHTSYGQYDGIFMLDVLEHIEPLDEAKALQHVSRSLQPNGIFIAGMPSIESQVHASAISRAGHVNCKSGEELRTTALKHFRNVFLFSMNDEIVHTGFSPMAHYLFVLCCGPISWRDRADD